MNKKILIVVVFLVLMAGGAASYSLFNWQRSRDNCARAELLVTAGGKAIANEEFATMVLILKSQPVLSQTISRIDPGKLWANHLLLHSQQHQHEYILNRLEAVRSVLPSTNITSDVITIRFHAEDGVMAKELLELILDSFQDQVRRIRDGSSVERMRLLDATIEMSNQKIRKLEESLLNVQKQINEITKENPADIASRVSRMKERIEDLKIQRKIAESQDKVSKIDAAIKEIEAGTARDEAILQSVRGPNAQLDRFSSELEQARKNKDKYEEDRLATILKEDQNRLQVNFLVRPTLDKR